MRSLEARLTGSSDLPSNEKERLSALLRATRLIVMLTQLWQMLAE